MHRASKNAAKIMVRQDIERNGKPQPRRVYADLWNVPPSTAYYWIKEAAAEAAMADRQAEYFDVVDVTEEVGDVLDEFLERNANRGGG